MLFSLALGIWVHSYISFHLSFIVWNEVSWIFIRFRVYMVLTVFFFFFLWYSLNLLLLFVLWPQVTVQVRWEGREKKMFFHIVLERNMQLHPRYFGRNLRDNLVSKLMKDVEGTCRWFTLRSFHSFLQNHSSSN